MRHAASSASTPLRLPVLTLLVLLSGLAACGGSDDGAAAPVAEPPPPPPPAPAPGLLPGDASARALDQLLDGDPPLAREDDIDGDTFLSRLYVVLDPAITVGDFNAAAASIGATAVYGRRGSRFVTLEVPRQSNAAAVGTLADTLELRSGISFATADELASIDELPGGPDGPVSEDRLDHLLATRFPAAWNVAAAAGDCQARPVRMIVFDTYGTVPADPFPFLALVPSFVPDGFEPPNLTDQNRSLHGYQVAATATALHDAIAPTGSNPIVECVLVEQVNSAQRGRVDSTHLLADRLAGLGENVVVNVSLGHSQKMCKTNVGGVCRREDLAALSDDALRDNVRYRAQSALHWAELGAGPDVHEKALLVVSAGNDRDKVLGSRYAGLRSARYNYFPQGVATLPRLQDEYRDPDLWLGQPQPGDPVLPSGVLTEGQINRLLSDFSQLPPGTDFSAANVLTVGATINAPELALLAPTDFSNEAFSVAAVGEHILIHDGNDTTPEKRIRGTSFAAPTVTGLAAYLWLLSDELRLRPVADTAALIRATARGNGRVSSVIDAYAAVLALDQPGRPLRIRRALLDRNGDERFDDSDLVAFQQELGLGQEAPAEVLTPDYRRGDLNGDGFTSPARSAVFDFGETTLEASRVTFFDLDVSGNTLTTAPLLTTVDVEIDGVLSTYDENAVSDLEVLCYYAYSDLYTGTAELRSNVLGVERCVGLEVDVEFPEVITGSGALLLAARRPDPSGQLVPVPDLVVELEVSNGVANPGTGTTSSEGLFSAAVIPDPDAAGVTVTITLRDEPGGRALATRIVSARVESDDPGNGEPGTLEVRSRVINLSWIGNVRLKTRNMSQPINLRLLNEDGSDRLLIRVIDQFVANNSEFPFRNFDPEEPFEGEILLSNDDLRGLGTARARYVMTATESTGGFDALSGIGALTARARIRTTCSLEVTRAAGVFTNCADPQAEECLEVRGTTSAQWAANVRQPAGEIDVSVNGSVFADLVEEVPGATRQDETRGFIFTSQGREVEALSPGGPLSDSATITYVKGFPGSTGETDSVFIDSAADCHGFRGPDEISAGGEFTVRIR
jgi:subtilisin family serine protease